MTFIRTTISVKFGLELEWKSLLTLIIAEDVMRKSIARSFTAFSFAALTTKFCDDVPCWLLELYCFSDSNSPNVVRSAVPCFPISLLHVSRSTNFASNGDKVALTCSEKITDINFATYVIAHTQLSLGKSCKSYTPIDKYHHHHFIGNSVS